MQPTGAMSSHSTKFQLKEKSPEAKFILSNTLHALLLFIFRNIQIQCRFSSVSFTHALTVRLARCTWLLLPGQHPRTRAWRLPSVGGAPGRPRRRVLRRPNPRGSRQGTERRLNAVRRRPTSLCSPRGLMHASARPVAPSPWLGKHRTCSLPPTGPRRPVLSNSPIAPNPSSIIT